MDYKKLLEKYMDHVASQEGIDFTGKSLDGNNNLTEHEKRCIRSISQKLCRPKEH